MHFQSFNYMYVRLVTNARGTLSQIAERFTHQKFCNQWLEDAKSRTDSIGEVVSRVYFKQNKKGVNFDGITAFDETTSQVPIVALSNEFSDVAQCQFFERARKDLILFHSLSYRKRQNTCSYVVSFDMVDEQIYGKIVQFVVSSNIVYAYAQLYTVTSMNIAEDIVPSNKHLKALWHQKINGTFFKEVQLSQSFRFLPVIYIKCRCIIITVDDITYLTEIAHMYEHN